MTPEAWDKVMMLLDLIEYHLHFVAGKLKRMDCSNTFNQEASNDENCNYH